MMLPLAGSAVPSTAEELARALDSGLRGCGLISREVTGDERRLAIDLTGAEASRATRLPVGRERIGPGPEIAEFALNAEPPGVSGIVLHAVVIEQPTAQPLASE